MGKSVDSLPLTICPACRVPVSVRAKTCPSCGHPLTPEARPLGRALKVVGIVTAILPAPLLTVDPVLCLICVTPGLALFLIGRARE